MYIRLEEWILLAYTLSMKKLLSLFGEFKSKMIKTNMLQSNDTFQLYMYLDHWLPLISLTLHRLYYCRSRHFLRLPCNAKYIHINCTIQNSQLHFLLHFCYTESCLATLYQFIHTNYTMICLHAYTVYQACI